MIPGTLNLQIYQGDSYIGPLIILPDLSPFGGPSNLSTATVGAQMRQKEWSADVLATFDVEIVSPTERTIRLTLDPADSAGLSTSGVWDLEVSTAQWTGTPLRGAVSVGEEVTRADV